MQDLVCSSDLRWMRALKAVAWFFIVTGIFRVLATIWSAVFYDRLVLDFGNLLNLFAGYGLLRLRRGWRLYLLVYLWITVPGGGILLALFPWLPLDQAYRNWYWLLFGGLLLIELLLASCLVVLLQPRVKALFRTDINRLECRANQENQEW